MLFTSVVLVALALCVGGDVLVDASTDKTTRIYDGTSAEIKDFPYLVGIVKDDTLLCAGVIVSKSWVMVLGDCVYTSSASSLKVVAGSNSISNGTSYSVLSSTKNPNYNHDFLMYQYDYFLLNIDGTFTERDTVGFVSLPSKALSTNSKVVAVGFADPSTGGMRQGTMKWQSDSTCTKYYTNYYVAASMGCTYDKGKVTLCYSDIGDPFVKDGVLYGFFSRGYVEGYCTSSAKPVLVASIISVVSWIEETTGLSS